MSLELDDVMFWDVERGGWLVDVGSGNVCVSHPIPFFCCLALKGTTGLPEVANRCFGVVKINVLCCTCQTL